MGSFDTEWSAWARRFDHAEQDLYTLYSLRYMARVVLGVAAHADVVKYPALDVYLHRTAVETICIEIRREVDSKDTTSGLRHTLQRLIDCPQLASRRRFQDLYTASFPEADVDIDAAFDRFAAPGAAYIDVGRVAADLARLQEAAKPVRDFVNKRVAHRDLTKRPPLDEAAIDAALAELSRVRRRYFGLRNPGVLLADIQPVVPLDFVNAFRRPWLSIEGRLPDWLPPLLRHEMPSTDEG